MIDMLQVVKRVYKNVQIVLDENPEVKPDTQVLVTFLDKDYSETINHAISSKKNGLVFGSLKGMISLPDNFDEPIDDLKDYM